MAGFLCIVLDFRLERYHFLNFIKHLGMHYSYDDQAVSSLFSNLVFITI
jgi:hypothetical protein